MPPLLRYLNRIKPSSLLDNFSNLRLFQNTANPQKGGFEQLYWNVRPAQSPFYVGTDICHRPRIQRVLFNESTESDEGSYSPPIVNRRFLERLFIDPEIEMQGEFLRNLNHQNKGHYAEFVAGR
jgi:hypothetical protein